MSCYKPWTAYRHPNGKVNQKKGADTEMVTLPCGACIGCHFDRSQMWSLRCRHEASCWENNAFLTLTYDDKNLPDFGSLDSAAPRTFIRYLRRSLCGVQRVPGGSARPIRYFGCGEYGSQRDRPHYHLLLFNVWFPDATKYGKETFTSGIVSRLWPYGSHLIGTVTPASSSYVAGYALKKVSAWERSQAYGVCSLPDGEWFDRVPEFPLMSTKPPIGWYWYDRYRQDLEHGFVVADGRQLAVPRLYRDKLALDDPAAYDAMQVNRQKKVRSYNSADRTEERLAVREAVFSAEKKFFKRSHLED